MESPGTASDRASDPLDASPARRWFAAALVAVTLLRLAAAASIPLSGDEAYYWTWTQHLALGYHDHPPMVAWVIALSTALLGTSTWAVRLPFVLMGSGTAWLAFVLGGEIGRTPRAALWAGGLALIIPLFTLAGLGVFPDSPMLLCAAGFFVCAWRATERGGAWWAAAGACAGGAGSSKLTGLYLIPAFLIFLALGARDRLRGVGPWVMMATAALVLSPFLYWNATHGFESVAYQYGSRLGSPQGRRKWYTPTFVLLSAVAISPVFYVLLLWASLRTGWLGWKGDARRLFAFCMAAPLHLVFFSLSFVTKIGLHWTAPGTLASFSAFGAWMNEAGGRGRRVAVAVAVAFAVLVSSLVYVFALAPATLIGVVSEGVQMSGINHGQPLKTQEITEILGYPQMGGQVRDMMAKARAEGAPPFLITTNYALSSALWFYSGEPFHVVMGTRIGAQYDHWDDFPSMIGRDALYIDTSPIDKREDVWENLHQAFEGVTLDPPIVSRGHGIEARTFYVARCRNFRRDVFTPLKSTSR